jgi:UDP-N-acetylmuramoyl-tripeptide--D-alanyl-D-alanine ligase
MEPEKIWQAMTFCKGQWGRNQIVKLPGGPTVLFDAYNANPDSAAMLIKNIYETPVAEGAKKVAVLGEMLELGDQAAMYHRELGELIGQSDVELVWFYGPDSGAFQAGLEKSGFSKTAIISDSYEESLAKKVRSMLNPIDVVVMKGSRGMRLERVMQTWDPSFQLQK